MGREREAARLSLIDRESLAQKLDLFAGAEFVAEVRAAFKVYGEVLSITKPAPEIPAAPSLADPLRALQAAIASYEIQWVAAVADDPQLTPLAMKALRPIDDLRSGQGEEAGEAGRERGNDGGYVSGLRAASPTARRAAPPPAPPAR